MDSATLDTIEDYLRYMAGMHRDIAEGRRSDWRFGSFEELVLHYGRPFTPAPRPEWMEQGEMKQCFSNSMGLAVERTDVIYVEGYANTRFFPMAHGWLTQDGATAIDPTWDDGTAYFGIPFTRSFWTRHMIQTGYWGVLHHEIPSESLMDLLKRGLPEGAIHEGDAP